MDRVALADFERVDIRIGTVIAAEPSPGAHKPAYILAVDFGPELGVKRSSARITERYIPQELLGRQVAAVVNFPAKQIGSVLSEVLILGFPDGEGGVILAGVDRPIPNGGKLY